jgi:hypothetical protein
MKHTSSGDNSYALPPALEDVVAIEIFNLGSVQCLEDMRSADKVV